MMAGATAVACWEKARAEAPKRLIQATGGGGLAAAPATMPGSTVVVAAVAMKAAIVAVPVEGADFRARHPPPPVAVLC